MKQRQTPDRVHVVREPEEDLNGDSVLPVILPSMAHGGLAGGRSSDIINTLSQISERLKRSESERYELLAELREHRKSLNALEDKTEKAEKDVQTLESRIKAQDGAESDVAQRQARFERALKEAESKLVQAAAGQNILDNRLNEMEMVHTKVNQRMDETIVQQARLDREIEKIGQDRQRTLRKVERMEEILNETQDTLRARALVLLTDQNSAAGAAAQIPAMTDDSQTQPSGAWWKRSVRLQNAGLASMVVAALLLGWAINQMQSQDMPRIAVLNDGSLAKLNAKENRWEALSGSSVASTPAPLTSEETQTAVPASAESASITTDTGDGTVAQNAPSETLAPDADVQAEEHPDAAIPQTPNAQAALNASDEKLMSAMEEDQDSLASQLNEISPQARQELDNVATPTPAAPIAAMGYDPLKPFAKEAFAQDSGLAAQITAETAGKPLSDRIAPDAALPAAAKDLETQAFAGNAEAQHDLAAIYTAGRGGVKQDFSKAALWFRAGADNKVANASYNLGVLYHQGLGVKKDMGRALYWYREAAKAGHKEAQYNLGIAYIEGIAPYNAPLAAAFFESAANKGVVEAAYNLGLINENGVATGKPRPEEALMWYKIAADGGNAEAKAALEQLSSSMDMDVDKVQQLASRMKAAYKTANGVVPGGTKAKG